MEMQKLQEEKVILKRTITSIMSMAIGMIAEKAMVSENSIELNVVPPSTRRLMAIYCLAMIIIFAMTKRRTKNESKIR